MSCLTPCAASLLLAVISIAGFPGTAEAGWDLTVFLGRSFPTSDDRLVLRPTIPSIPELGVTVSGSPELRTVGGPVFGAALAWEAGVLGIEGRIDATDVGFDFTGATVDVRPLVPSFPGISAHVTLGNGHFDTDRLNLLSLNGRLRTPGPVGLVLSGGFSYLPDFDIRGAVPITVAVSGISVAPGIAPQLRVAVGPGESGSRFGVNGGAGVRIGGSHLALMAEARAFYFKDYALTFSVADAPAVLNELLGNIEPVGFRPVIVNAQAGLVLKF